MRKLLHAIHGMFDHDAQFDGLKFYAISARQERADKRSDLNATACRSLFFGRPKDQEGLWDFADRVDVLS